MATVTDALSARTMIGGPLAAGVDTVSLKQEITFDLYAQVILPIDGFVFWVKASRLSASALINASPINSFALNQGSSSSTPAQVPALTFKAMGSLHYATDSRQTDEANYASNRVIFTSEVPLQDMNLIGPKLMYIGTFDSPNAQTPNAPRTTTPIRFAFSSRGSFYQQADLWHYTGNAVYSFMASQIVDDPELLVTNRAIVSNSIPLWLEYGQFRPDWPVPVPRPRIAIYPAMLSTDNEEPPFITVRIDRTVSEQSAPFLTRVTNQYELCTDDVTMTIFGASNSVAQDILQSILQFSYDTGTFGITNVPVITDPRLGQNELNVLAQKKVIEFQVSYNQSTVRNVARQLIEHCIVTVQAGEQVIPSS